MIADVFKFLRDRLNNSLQRDASEGAAEDSFVYVGTSKDDAVNFKPDAVSIMLVRIEEETTLRQADPYLRTTDKGVHEKVSPEIRMNLWVLFVARFPDDYSKSLQYLSHVISYFQNNFVFTHDNAPELASKISKLILKLVTPTFSEQNEIWGSLRAAYQPSALYKIQMVVFEDGDGSSLPSVSEVNRSIRQVSS